MTGEATGRKRKGVRAMGEDTDDNGEGSMVTIEYGSEAWAYLAGAIAEDEARVIRIDIRAGGVAVKVDEFVWTPTMRTVKRV